MITVYGIPARRGLRAVVAEHCSGHLPEPDTALGTELRLSEQCGLKWDAIDSRRKEIRLQKTKNHSGRSIPMNAEVLSAFELLRAQAGREQGRVVDTANLREWFACAFEKAMIKNFRWHDCRDRFCSKLAMKGVNLKAIQTLAGHKTIAMSARYAHLSPDVITAAFERMVGTLTA